MNMCYYKLLGVEPSATVEQIKKAYRIKAHQLHPDKNTDNDNIKEFQAINEAYETLGNVKKRTAYDTLKGDDYTAILRSVDQDYEMFFDFLDIDEIHYNTSIYTVKCDCDDWREKRSEYYIDDPRRLCKHLILEFQVVELKNINVPQKLKPFEKEILQCRYQKVGFPLYKEIIHFETSIVAISEDEENILLYIKEHVNPKCIHSIFYVHRDLNNSYLWANNNNKNGISFRSSDKKILDAKEYIHNRFNVQNSDVSLCQRCTEELLKEKADAHAAKEKGYLLSKSFEYSLPDYVQNNNIEDAYKKKEVYLKLNDEKLNCFDTSTNLLKEHKSRFTARSFNKKLVDLGYLSKEKFLNNDGWILKGDALKYGMNYIYNSKYTHIKIPKWYVITSFDFKTLSFKNETRYGLKRMTKVLFEKDKFEDLLALMNQHISEQKPKSKARVVYQEEKPTFTVLRKPQKTIFQKIKDVVMA